MTHNDKDFKLIPFTNFRYFINEDGVIYDVKNNIDVHIDSNCKCELVIFDEVRQVDQAWVLLVVFDPIYKADKFILDWTVLRKNNYLTNITLTNLLWKPPKGGQESPELKTFYIIPFHTRYCISKDGRVFDRKMMKTVPIRIAYPKIENSYVNVDLRSFDSKTSQTMGVHRLIGLALLEYNERVLRLTVNHKDGVKTNNVSSNLEWMTYRDNNIHARDTGLQNTRRVTAVKDYLTKEIRLFESMTRAAEFININSATLCECINKSPDNLIKNRYIARYNKPDLIWPDICENVIKETPLRNPKPYENTDCWAYNILTDELIVASDAFQLSLLINLPLKYIKEVCLISNKEWPNKNYICGWMKNGIKTRKYPSIVKEAFKDKSNIRSPIYAEYPDGKTQVFVSGMELSKKLGKAERFIDYKLKDNNGKPVVMDNIVIIPLKNVIESLCI